jgi:death on curing protein
VLNYNQMEVDATGERHFLRDRALLESALARPQNAFAYGEEDIVVLAVRLMAGIAQAHAFEQGNKRTAVEAPWHFLRLNGYDLGIEDSAEWEEPVVALVEHRSPRRSLSPCCARSSLRASEPAQISCVGCVPRLLCAA